MADEQEVVETTEQEVFDKELEEVQRKTEAQIGFERRQSLKSKEEKDDAELEEDVADKVAKKILPIIQAQNEKTLLETKLSKWDSNPSLKKLIQYHLENTVSPNAGTLDERLEYAESNARRKTILKQASEITLATQNKKQIQNNSQGSGSATQQEGKDKDFSSEQLVDLERRAKKLNLDPKTYIERLRMNMQKSGGR